MRTLIQHSLDTDIAKQISSNFDLFNTHIRHQTTADLNDLRQTHQTDFNHLPKLDFSQIKLFVSDMDSTLINIECIDEIADFAHLKTEASSITERAMQGELDFDTSLIERVALLKNLPIQVLDEVYQTRLKPNPGAIELIDFFKTKAIKTAVVSGGFSYFTERLKNDLALDHARANTLEQADNRLTGKVIGNIINTKAKANFVHELCQEYALSTQQVLVVGDGANDLAMMKVAGLSVAYHGKPIAQQQADIAINFGGLDKIMDFFNH